MIQNYPPITLGSRGETVQKLHTEIFRLINDQKIKNFELPLLNLFQTESEKMFYGEATAYFLTQIHHAAIFPFEMEKGIGQDFFDNLALFYNKELASQPIRIFGKLKNSLGFPVPSANLIIYANPTSLSPSRFQAISHEDGTYELIINRDELIIQESNKTMPISVQIHVLINNNDEGPKYKDFSTGYYDDVSGSREINIIIDDVASNYVISEFERVDALVSKHYTEDQIAILAEQNTLSVAATIEESERVTLSYILSKKYARLTDLLPQHFYGLLSKTKPQRLEILINMSKEEVISAINLSIATNIISHSFDRTASDFADGLNYAGAKIVIHSSNGTPEEAKTYNVLKNVFEEDEMTQFITYYNENKQVPDAMQFESISSTLPYIDRTKFDALQNTIKLSILTGNNPAIVSTLINTPRTEYVNRPVEVWKKEIISTKSANSNFVFPSYLTGTTDSAKVSEYATILKNNIDHSFPHLVIQNQILGDVSSPLAELKNSLSAFSSLNPTFNLLGTPITELEDSSKFNLEPLSNPDAFIKEVSSLQRLSAISSDYTVVKSLLNANITSARDIANLPQAQLASILPSTVSSSLLDELKYKALDQVMVSQVIATNLWTSFVGFSATAPIPTQANPEWRTLFPNTLDMCCCDQCQSIFSPSAYLVDCLELLRKQSTFIPKEAYNLLKSKRPDLWQIELSCKNTNTPLPYIDLVNEILEDMIVSSFAGNSTYPAIRANNTTWDEKTLHAIPEYIYSTGTNNPYSVLKTALYPWNAPYNYFQSQINEYLNLIDIKPFQIAEALSNLKDSYNIGTIDLAKAYLNINADMLTILTDDTNQSLVKYYGFKKDSANAYYVTDPQDRSNKILLSGTNMLPTTPLLQRVDIFLQQSNVTYRDLLDLLDCYYINPFTSSSIRKMKIETIDGKPIDTCLLSDLIIQGIKEIDLRRIHTFVRLKKLLGWSFYQLDKTFKVIGVTSGNPITNTTIIRLGQLKKIEELLGCTIDEILVFWRDIDDEMYTQYQKDNPQLIPTEYESIFRNPKIIQDIAATSSYPFPARLNQLVSTNATIAMDQKNYLLGAINLPESNYNALVRNTSFFNFDGSQAQEIKFSINHISRIYRENKLLNLLNLSINEYIFYRKTSIFDPFALDSNNFNSFFDFIKSISFINGLQWDEASINEALVATYASDEIRTNRKTELTQQLEDLRLLLVKNSTPAMKNEGTASAPIYTVDKDALRLKLETVLTSPQVELLLKNIGGVTEVSELAANDIASFNALVSSQFSTTEITELQAKLISNGTNFIKSENDRLAYIHDKFAKKIFNNLIIKYFEKLFKVPSNIVESFLNTPSTVHGGTTMDPMTIYNSATFISKNPITVATLFSDTSLENTARYQILDKFYRFKILFEKFDFKLSEIVFLRDNKSILGIPSIDLYNLPSDPILLNGNTINMISGSDIYRLIEWMYVRNKIGTSRWTIFDILTETQLQSNEANKRSKWVSVFSSAIGVDPADLNILYAELGLNFASTTNAQLMPSTYLRVLNALEMASHFEISIGNLKAIKTAISSQSNQNDANVVIQIIKSKYTSVEWLQKIKPTNDQLRIQRRDAMVAYLLAYPPQVYNHWNTPEDLFESLCIDSQMMPIVKTSRIKQMISALQIFYDRCILQKERTKNGETIYLTKEDIRQWGLWRKYYRVWEANRRVFVYPENWIEPELREDKSPFFKEMEKFLKQNELNDDNIRDAFENYFEKLEEISNLEIIAQYNENPSASALYDIVHVWGRTKSNPSVYFYRKRVLNEWTAWEKMNIEIEGDHFSVIKHNGRLKFFWLTFEEKSRTKNAKFKENKVIYPIKNWKIGLKWTEYKNNRWTSPSLSKTYIDAPELENGKWHWAGSFDQYDDVTEFIKDAVYNNFNSSCHMFTEKTFEHSFQYMKKTTQAYISINNSNQIILSLEGSSKFVGLPKFIRNCDINSVSRSNTIQIQEMLENYYFSSSELWFRKYGYFTIDQKQVLAQNTENFNIVGTTALSSSVIEDHALNEISNFATTLYSGGVDTTLGTNLSLTSIDNRYNLSNPSGIYFWELFFHIPMLIANKLMKDQKFFEAMKWYHYVFNPTNGSASSPINITHSSNFVERFWLFYPFFSQASNGIPTLDSIMKDSQLHNQVKRWAADPFKPHLVARTRISAYMKNVVMKYLDNLMAWGDMLFQKDTIESINEATLLYILAAQLLGKSPNACIPQRASTGNRKYQDFEDNPDKINDFSNALLRIESVMAPTGMSQLIDNPLYSYVLSRQVISLTSSSSSNVISKSTTMPTWPFSGIPTESGFATQKNNITTYYDFKINPNYIFKDFLFNNPFKPTLSSYVQVKNPNLLTMFYFCIPQNDKLLSYWSMVADRLFKIRNSQNIEGVERQLALFEPPIDPALLVKAAAMGMSLSDALNDVYTPMPTYRFQVMVQKAAELAQEVKSLGASMLSALEKKDAESLTLLRNSKEMELLEMIKDLKSLQIKEAQIQLTALQDQQKLITLRRDYYNILIAGGLNEGETSQLDSMKLSIPLKMSAQALHIIGGTLNLIPDFKIGSPFSMGATFGGTNIGNSIKSAGDVLNILATINDIEGSMAGIKGGYARREAEWKNQLKSTNIELKQIEKQLLASQIKIEMAQAEYQNHLKQMDNSKVIDEAMRNKFTNEDLYDWMIGELSTTYFQSYKLAYDVARRAERCYHYELCTDPTNAPTFIQYGYWDSLKKGLLSGEALLFDVKRMDVAYLDNNKRLHEMTKHISLALTNPKAILDLKKNRKTVFELPEWIFDMDYPGHYMRRIKSVSISIPCVAGPYTTVAAKLTLNKNKIRKNTAATSGAIYGAQNENHFTTSFIGGQSIATSSAQNDSGMFELNFRDERYLPFEGAGVISEWVLEIPSEYAQFDINTISDVIIHLNYTAKYDGALKLRALEYMKALFVADNTPLPRVFNLKQEFANEWNAYVNDVKNGVANAALKVKLNHSLFPNFCKGKDLTLYKALASYQSKDATSVTFGLNSSTLFTAPTAPATNFVLTNGTPSAYIPVKTNQKITTGTDKEIELKLSSPNLISEIDTIRDLFFVLIYKKSE